MEKSEWSDEAAFSRLILFRPRPEFPLPAEWRERSWIPLGALRPLLQAVSPVRDLSDLWRWVAEPLAAADVEAALAARPEVEVRWEEPHRGVARSVQSPRERGRTLRATLVPSVAQGEVERVGLGEAKESLLGITRPETIAAMRDVAEALRRTCGCIAVGL